MYRQVEHYLEKVSVTRLTIYGDFNCPFSALASVRADVLLAAGAYEVDWRAVQHDTAIPTAGEVVEGDTAAGLTDEVATIARLSEQDVRLQLVVPPVRSNTAAACAALAAAAGDGAARLRARLFAAVWAEGRNLSDPADLVGLGAVGRDDVAARRWQDEFEALPQPMTPTLVLPDGYISRGLGALARLAEFVAASSSPSPMETNE
jgi:2-hydroxychromene-2-carboxylate isomerase